jgi:hypothetical protein
MSRVTTGVVAGQGVKKAAADARRERRRLAREAVGELGPMDEDRTPLVSMPTNNPSTGVNADRSVVEAVGEELSTLDSPRPGLVAVAIAMARILENPRAVSSQPMSRCSATRRSCSRNTSAWDSTRFVLSPRP